MNSIYVFKYVPSSVKRLIYIYLIGLGTPTSKLIKEEYDKLYKKSQDQIIVTYHMSMYQARDIGFMGCKTCVKNYFTRTFSVGKYKKYKGDIIGSNNNEECLLHRHFYEIDCAKMFYLYNYSNAYKFNLMVTLVADFKSVEKLFKYKILQIKSEEE